MSEYKKGDRVLVESFWLGPGKHLGTVDWVVENRIYVMLDDGRYRRLTRDYLTHAKKGTK